ncbi:MAG: hypothetical protein ACYS6W_01550 [Planctomycetota bacterium]|jgi:hypothetical protein
MDNNQIKFLGACMILGCSILAIAIGFLAYATARHHFYGMVFIPGVIGVVVAAYIGITAWLKLRSSKDK